MNFGKIMSGRSRRWKEPAILSWKKRSKKVRKKASNNERNENAVQE
jgi:hypothetical protein